MKQRSKAELWLDSRSAEWLFGSTNMLISLCEKQAQLEFFRQLYGRQEAEELPNQLFAGFKLAFIALLHRIITQVINAPQSLGIRRSEKMDTAYFFGANERSIHQLPNLSSQGIFVENMLIFRKKILESKEWNTFWMETEALRDHLNKIMAVFLSCYIGKIADSKEALSPEDALKTKLPEVLLIFMNDENKLELAFKEMYRLNPASVRLEQHKMPLERKEAETNEDPFQMLNELLLNSRQSFMEVSARVELFLEGFKFANVALWKLALGEQEFGKQLEQFGAIQGATSWSEFDEAFEKLNAGIVSEFEEKKSSKQVSLVLAKKVPIALRRQLIVPLEKQKAIQVKLSDVFDHRPAKVVGFEGSNGAMQFCTVLFGLVYQHSLKFMQEKPKVIEFVHKRRYGNDYSFAVLMPASSNNADYSRWWVFYRCATDHSGYGGSCFAYITSCLKGLKGLIRCRKFAIDEEAFFEHFKSDYIQFIEKECRKATDDNRLLRGAFLELLIAQIFVNNGFKVRLRHKSQLLGGKEIDVVATKQDGETSIIYVVECKERSLTADTEEFDRISKELFEKSREERKGVFSVSHSDAMFKIIEDFQTEKVTPLQAKLKEFAEEIRLPYEGDIKLVGLVATTELFETPTQVLPDVELWTYWTIKKKLQETKISKSFLEIIEKYLEGNIGMPIADLHFYQDYFD